MNRIALENLELNLERLNKAYDALDNLGNDLTEELEVAKEFLSKSIDEVEDEITDLIEGN